MQSGAYLVANKVQFNFNERATKVKIVKKQPEYSEALLKASTYSWFLWPPFGF